MTTCKSILLIYFADENSRYLSFGTVKNFLKGCNGALTAIDGVEKADAQVLSSLNSTD